MAMGMSRVALMLHEPDGLEVAIQPSVRYCGEGSRATWPEDEPLPCDTTTAM